MIFPFSNFVCIFSLGTYMPPVICVHCCNNLPSFCCFPQSTRGQCGLFPIQAMLAILLSISKSSWCLIFQPCSGSCIKEPELLPSATRRSFTQRTSSCPLATPRLHVTHIPSRSYAGCNSLIDTSPSFQVWFLTSLPTISHSPNPQATTSQFSISRNHTLLCGCIYIQREKNCLLTTDSSTMTSTSSKANYKSYEAQARLVRAIVAAHPSTRWNYKGNTYLYFLLVWFSC